MHQQNLVFQFSFVLILKIETLESEKSAFFDHTKRYLQAVRK